VVCVLVGIMLAGLYTSCFASAQEKSQAPNRKLACTDVRSCESNIREAEQGHADNVALATIYQAFANAEHNVGNLPKAESAMKKAANLLRDGQQDILAGVLTQLATLHVESGNPHASRKELERVLSIREKLGNPVELALTWDDIADLNLRLGRFDDALRYAERANVVLRNDSRVSLKDRIAMRQTLGNALCRTGSHERAITVLSEAAEMADTQIGKNTVDAGVAKFLLGSAYWRSGQMDAASTWMAEGIAGLRDSTAWGRAPYLHALTEYIRFLRVRGDTDAARAAEREIVAANSTVSVAALTR
jgi:tetratricopeptide (TPR) repeat protein